MKKINITEKFVQINEYWKPYIVGELNGQYVKLDKFKGPFTWHHHENEDEMFLVVKGEFDMMLRNETMRIKKASLLSFQGESNIVHLRRMKFMFYYLSQIQL